MLYILNTYAAGFFFTFDIFSKAEKQSLWTKYFKTSLSNYTKEGCFLINLKPEKKKSIIAIY